MRVVFHEGIRRNQSSRFVLGKNHFPMQNTAFLTRTTGFLQTTAQAFRFMGA
jgi:hypothetical protein